jgi:hypothetical protein
MCGNIEQSGWKRFRMEMLDPCTIKLDDDLTKERAFEIKQRIDDVQDDLDFIRGWLNRHIKNDDSANSDTASLIRGDAFWAWNHLQTVYRFLAKVISNAQN